MFSGNAYIAVAAIGMSMVIISGNIDVSVGSLIGVLATIAGTLAVERLSDLDVLAGADPGRHPDQCRRRRARRLCAHPVDRGHSRHAVDAEGRPDQRHRRRLDLGHAGGLLPRPDAALRDSGAGLFHGHPDGGGGAVDALFGVRPLDLCDRRQSGGGARRRHPDRAVDRRHLRDPRASSPASPRSSSRPSCRSSSRRCRPISN